MDPFHNGNKRSSISFGSSQRQPYNKNNYLSGTNGPSSVAQDQGRGPSPFGMSGNTTNGGNSKRNSGCDLSATYYASRSPMYSPLDFSPPVFSPNHSQLQQARGYAANIPVVSNLMNPSMASVCEYQSHYPLFGLDWSADDYVCLGSYKEDSRNKLQVLHSNDLLSWESVVDADVVYPVSKIQWVPSQLYPRKLATCSDSLRIWSVSPEERQFQEQINLSLCKYNRQHPASPAAADDMKVIGTFPPITSFDWNTVDTNLIISSSIDTTCIVWDLQSSHYVKTQLIAHDSEVFDVRFLTKSTQLFASCGGDGSVRVFDLRSLAHSTIIYEPPSSSVSGATAGTITPSSKGSDALLRLEPSPYDPNVLATFAADSNKIIILDMRNPESPILNLQGHGSSVNGIKWHPTKRNVLLSCGDDCQVLYWDLNSSFMEINAAGSKSPSIHGTSLEDPDGDTEMTDGGAGSGLNEDPLSLNNNSKQVCKTLETPNMMYANKTQEINNIAWRPQRGDWFGCVSGKKFQNVRVL
ncbi:BAK_1a_G0052590.mRNA.1.CDS.1 [Saccharomyces cerevisiae]|nr:BAK_1a_G0052590.mRNA.1.CDS.1 [Saccharomyces cerevisiae]CAI7364577.1 BAK_1a_G0052590.mRNA.1.CDS.1 [Saccharomyces cerevisiae]